jgi:hypothetical protein
MTDITSELGALSALHDSGALSHAEFATAKQRILGGGIKGALPQSAQYGAPRPPVATVFATAVPHVPVAQARVVQAHAVAVPLGLQMQRSGTVNPSALRVCPAPITGADGPVPPRRLDLILLPLAELANAPPGLDVRQSDAGLTFTRRLWTAPSMQRGCLRLAALALAAFFFCSTLALVPIYYIYSTGSIGVNIYSILLVCLVEVSAALLCRLTCVNYAYFGAQTMRNSVVVTLDAQSALLSSRIYPLSNKGLLWPLGNIFEDEEATLALASEVRHASVSSIARVWRPRREFCVGCPGEEGRGCCFVRQSVRGDLNTLCSNRPGVRINVYPSKGSAYRPRGNEEVENFGRIAKKVRRSPAPLRWLQRKTSAIVHLPDALTLVPRCTTLYPVQFGGMICKYYSRLTNWGKIFCCKGVPDVAAARPTLARLPAEDAAFIHACLVAALGVEGQEEHDAENVLRKEQGRPMLGSEGVWGWVEGLAIFLAAVLMALGFLVPTLILMFLSNVFRSLV